MAGNGQDRSYSEMLEELTGLYQRDPEKFEEVRSALIEKVVQSFPEAHRQRAYGLQFKIDHRLKKFHDPVSRMNMMVEIFWEHFKVFHKVLNDPEGYMKERSQYKGTDNVIPMDPEERRKLH